MSGKKKKLYCGSCEKLPSAIYSRFGTPSECLAIGIGVGRKIEFDHMQVRLNKKGIKVRRSKGKSCCKKSIKKKK